MAIRLIYVFLLTLLLPLNILLTEADDRLIQTECHNADSPSTCLQCLKSGNRSLNADKFEIADIIVECLGKHAANLGGNMSDLARGVPDRSSSSKVYNDCAQLFLRATKELESAGEEIKNGDYDSADRSLFSARNCNFKCSSYVGKGKSKSEVPSAVSSEMMVFEQLSEAAMRIVERF